MSIRLKRRGANTSIEKSIITGMIVSTTYLQGITPVFDGKYLKNDYARIVAKWVMQYYERYKECPSKHIADIYKTEKEKIKEADAEIISQFLDDLSRKFEDETRFNSEYLLDRTIEYFKEAALTLTAENMLAYIGSGEIDKAEEEFIKYKKVAKITSNWIDPFEKEWRKNTTQTHFAAS